MKSKYLQQKGIGLVEIIVALFAGIIAAIAIYTSVSFYQNSSRSLAAGNTALSQGLFGIQSLMNDIELGGMGFTAENDFACISFNIYRNGVTLADDDVIPPVLITDGGTASDAVTVFFADSIDAGAPSLLLADMSNPDGTITVNLAAAEQDSLALLARENAAVPCTLIAITQVDNLGNGLVLHHSDTNVYNPASAATAFSNPITYVTNDFLMHLVNLNWRTWSVANDRLVVQDNISGTSTPIEESVMGIKAQYGVTDGTNNMISQWVSATGAWETLNETEVRRIKAIRLGILTRSVQKQKPNPATGVCDATTTSPPLWSGGPTIDLTANADWRCYHYRVISTVIPLKNVMWGGIEL